MQNNSYHAHGFSLLEILLVLVLLALLMSGAFVGMRTVIRATERGEALIEKTNKVRVVQEFLRRQIAHTLAMPFEFATDTGEPVVFQGNDQSVTFVAPMPGYLGHGGPYVQSLQLEESHEHGTQLVFRHLLLNAYDPEEDNLSPVEPVVLLENITHAQFAYQGLDENGELSDWQDQWELTSQTPLLVRLQIDFDPASGLEWPDLIIPLRINSTNTSNFGPRFEISVIPTTIQKPK